MKTALYKIHIKPPSLLLNHSKPENHGPLFLGDIWHVTGTCNDSLCATLEACCLPDGDVMSTSYMWNDICCQGWCPPGPVPCVFCPFGVALVCFLRPKLASGSDADTPSIIILRLAWDLLHLCVTFLVWFWPLLSACLIYVLFMVTLPVPCLCSILLVFLDFS